MSIWTTIFSKLRLTISVPTPIADQDQAFAGMDMYYYPGDDFMRYLQNVTNIKWTCAYMHAPGHPDPAWASEGGARKARALGFGIAATYLGNQDPSVPKPHDLQPATGRADGLDAVQQAAVDMGLPDHAVLYLDWETSQPITPAGIAYCLAWFRAVAEAGFRPCLYAHSLSSMELRKEWPDLLVWVPVPRKTFEETWAINDKSATVNVKDPRDNIDVLGHVDPDAVACQMWWQKRFPWPANTSFPKPKNPALPIPTTLFHGGNAFITKKISTFTIPRHPAFDMDVTSSCMKDPSFPEATASPGLVRGGRPGAQVLSNTSIALFRIRGGKLDAVQSVGTGPNWTGLSVDNAARLLTFHPWSPPRALQRGTAGDLVVITRSGTFGTAEDRWDLHAYRRRGTTWTVDGAINGSTVVSPLLGACLVSRAPDAVEVMFQGQDLRLYTISTVDAQTQGDNQPWTTPDPLPVPPGFSPSRVGGLGAVSRTSGTADFFVVAKATADPVWRLYWVASAALGSFSGSFAIPISPDPVARVHPFSNVAAVARDSQTIDAFVIAQGPTDTDWKVYHWYWTDTGGWGVSPNLHVESIGGAQIFPHPVSKIAAISYSSQSVQCIDVFIVGNSDGFLYFTHWNGVSWSGFVRIGTGTITVASVDAAIVRSSPTVIDVIVTGRDGNVYASTCTNNLVGYSTLAQVAELALAGS